MREVNLLRNLFIMLSLAFGMSALAADFQADGLCYSFNTDNAVTVMALEQESVSGSYAGDIVIPEKVTYEETEYTVTSIDAEAFVGCYQLTSVSIPKTVTSIGDEPFMACNSLRAVNVDVSNPAYSSQDGVLFDKDATTIIVCPAAKAGSYTIPSTVTAISASAFYGCAQLTAVSIPSSVKEVGNSAFRDCSKLTTITLPGGVREIAPKTFYGCTQLRSAALPSSLSVIGASAFFRCSSLSFVSIPASLTEIHSHAFESCTALTSLTLPKGLEVIATHAFEGCTRLSTLVIPSTVHTIEACAFAKCTSMKSLLVAASNATYTSQGGVIYSKDMTTLVCCPSGKSGSLSIPETVTSLGAYSMAFCDQLTSVVLPSSLTQIGDDALYACTGLTTLTIPQGVKKIGAGAFYYCYDLESITCYPSAVPSLSGNILTSAMYGEVTLYVPTQLLSKYKSARGWKSFSHILPIEEKLSCSSELAYPMASTSVTLSMLVANTNVRSYEMYFHLPEGVTPLMRSEGIPACEFPSPRYKGGSVTANMEQVGDNDYYLRVTLSDDCTFVGNEGELLKCWFKVGNLPYGEAVGYIDQTVVTYFDGTETAVQDCDILIAVENGLLGDANGDGKVNVADVMVTVNKVMGRDSAVFIWQLADVNRDAQFSVADVMGIVGIVLGNP